jgi:tetratricopeptide (TPR) repeat protein
MTLVPLALFGCLELGLQLAGVGRNTHFFQDGSKLESADVWIDNPEFGRWAFPQGLDQTPCPIPFLLADPKNKDTFRIFVLGESAAMGFPEPSFSFARILEVMLKARYAGQRFEVINVAMTAINSHIVLPIARECADHEPDLFVVHLGNNEVVGPYGAAGVLGSSAPSLTAIRANLAIRRTRLGQLFSSGAERFKAGGTAPKAWGGMAMFTNAQVRGDDPRLTRTYEQFRENLRDICRVGAAAKIPVIVCTIPVNLKDSAPFGSLHAASLSVEDQAKWESHYNLGVRLEAEKQFASALTEYSEAAKLDDQFADLEFRQGRSLWSLGRPEEAREKLLRARDLDTLRFRSDTVINRTIREVVAEGASRGTHLADAEHAFAAASTNNVPGEEWFLEHVHTNFAGNYLLALTVFQSLTPILDERSFEIRQADPLTQEQCAKRLAYTDWNELKIFAQVRSNMLRQPPFTNQLDWEARNVRWQEKVRELHHRLDRAGLQQAVNIHGEAVDNAKRDWMLRMNYASLLTEVSDFALAEEQYKTILASYRHCFTAHAKIGNLMLRTGRLDEAEFHFREALRLDPNFSEAQLGLAGVYGAQGKVDEGLALFEAQLAKTADRGALLYALGAYLQKAGRLEEARRRLEESLEANPDNPMAHASLGDIALKQNRKEEALGAFERALQMRPDWPELQNYLKQLKGEGTTNPSKK